MQQQPVGFGVSATARDLGISEGHVRHLERCGVVTARRDSAGRRQFTADQIEAMRSHMMCASRKRVAG